MQMEKNSNTTLTPICNVLPLFTMLYHPHICIGIFHATSIWQSLTPWNYYSSYCSSILTKTQEITTKNE